MGKCNEENCMKNNAKMSEKMNCIRYANWIHEYVMVGRNNFLTEET